MNATILQLGLSQVGRRYGLTHRAIRFYEEVGLLSVARDRRNLRTYDAEACRRLGKIAELRRLGLSLEDIRQVFELEQHTGGAELYLLAKLRARLNLLRDQVRTVEAVMNDLASPSADDASDASTRNARLRHG